MGPAGGAGRPRVGLSLIPDRITVLGAELRPDSVSVVMQGLDGVIADRYRIPFDQRLNSFDEIWERFQSVVSERVPEQTTAVSVAVPATVDPSQGIILDAEEIRGERFAPVQPLGKGSAIPVVLENDANAVAWGALAALGRTDGDTTTDLLVVTGRRDRSRGEMRVGSAIVIGRKVYYGSDFGGGEFRSSAWRSGMSGELSAGNGDDRATLIELLSNLSVPMSMLRPAALIVAGDLAPMVPLIEDVLARELHGAYVDPRVSRIPIVPAMEGAYSVAAGAASMFLEHLFAVPTHDYRRPLAMPGWLEI